MLCTHTHTPFLSCFYLKRAYRPYTPRQPRAIFVGILFYTFILHNVNLWVYKRLFRIIFCRNFHWSFFPWVRFRPSSSTLQIENVLGISMSISGFIQWFCYWCLFTNANNNHVNGYDRFSYQELKKNCICYSISKHDSMSDNAIKFIPDILQNKKQHNKNVYFHINKSNQRI